MSVHPLVVSVCGGRFGVIDGPEVLTLCVCVCARPGRDFCVMGDLATAAGWKHYELVKRLEGVRKAKSNAFFLKKKEMTKIRAEAASEADA